MHFISFIIPGYAAYEVQIPCLAQLTGRICTKVRRLLCVMKKSRFNDCCIMLEGLLDRYEIIGRSNNFVRASDC